MAADQARDDYLTPIASALRRWAEPAGWSVLAGRRGISAPRGAALVPFLGANFSTTGALSQVDLAVVRPDREVALIVEVRPRSVAPDRVLGIVANVLLADGLRFGDLTYTIAETQLLVAVVSSARGPARSRLATLEDRLNWAAVALARQGKPRLGAVRLATTNSIEKLPALVTVEAQEMVPRPAH